MQLIVDINVLKSAAGQLAKLREDMRESLILMLKLLMKARYLPLNNYLNRKGIEISALGYYPNPL